MAEKPTGGRVSDKNSVKPNKKASFAGFANEAVRRGGRDSNPQPPDRQSGGIEFEVGTSQELRQSGNPVAPNVAPAKPKTHGNKPAETDFAAALMMIAGLPLSDADKAEAVKRLLRGAYPVNRRDLIGSFRWEEAISLADHPQPHRNAIIVFVAASVGFQSSTKAEPLFRANVT